MSLIEAVAFGVVFFAAVWYLRPGTGRVTDSKPRPPGNPPVGRPGKKDAL